MGNDSSNESPAVTEAEVKAALDLVSKGLETTSKAIFDGAKTFNDASQRFAEKAPGQRASWLGFLLVISAISLEIFSGLRPSFVFSDTTSAGMLVIGGLLVVAGGAFDTYFTVKTVQAYEAQAASLERTAEEVREEAKQVRGEGRGFLSRLVGKG